MNPEIRKKIKEATRRAKMSRRILNILTEKGIVNLRDGRPYTMERILVCMSNDQPEANIDAAAIQGLKDYAEELAAARNLAKQELSTIEL